MPKRPRPKAKPADIKKRATRQANRAAYDNLRATPQYGGGTQATSKKKTTARKKTPVRKKAPARRPGPSATQRYNRMMTHIKK